MHLPKAILIHDVPETVHQQLKARAAHAGLSLSAFLLDELGRVAAEPTPEAPLLAERAANRPSVEDPVAAVRAERRRR